MLTAQYPNCLIHNSDEDVGLPAGTMGNSEVGHQNIGAGRIAAQESVRLSRAIRDGSFFENKEFLNLIKFIKEKNGRLHLMGLCSDIGVHSLLDHLYGLLELAKPSNRSLPWPSLGSVRLDQRPIRLAFPLDFSVARPNEHA